MSASRGEPRVEILYFEGCPGFTETLNVLEKALAEEGIPARVLPVLLGPDDWSGLPGSPTVLVDGEDLFPTRHDRVRTVSCRIYPTPEGPKNYPTAAMAREALKERLAKG